MIHFGNFKNIFLIGNSYVYKTKHEVRDDSACGVCFQIDAETVETTVMSMIIIQIISNPYYETLRTKFVYVYIYSEKTKKI